MKALLHFFFSELKNLKRRPWAVSIIFGLTLLPALYAGINVLGSWEPYEHTDQLTIAIVNEDEGYSSKLLLTSYNLGKDLSYDLLSSTSIHYKLENKAEALDDVSAGRAYAALIIPKDFTSALLSFDKTNAQAPKLAFYENQKRNPIANLVTGKASDSVSTKVKEELYYSLTHNLAEKLEGISAKLTDDQTKELASKLQEKLSGLTDKLNLGADSLDSWADTVQNLSLLNNSSDKLFAASYQVLNTAEDSLSEGLKAKANLSTELDQTKTKLDALKQTQKEDATKLQADIQKSLDANSATTDDLKSYLTQLKGTIQDRKTKLSGLKDKVHELNSEGPLASKLNLLEDNLSAQLQLLDRALERLDQSLQKLDETHNSVAGAKEDLAKDLADITTLSDHLDTEYSTKLSAELASLKDTLGSDSSELASKLEQIQTKGKELQADGKALSEELNSAATSMHSKADELRQKAKDLDGFNAELTDSLNSSDLQRVKKILTANPSSLADFISNPVEVTKERIYPIENNGSAMTPYYSTMSLWVGATLMGCILVTPHYKKKDKLSRKSTLYFGRYLLYLSISLSQALLVSALNLLYMQVQCTDPLFFVVTLCVAAFCFVSFVYALASSFGDVGKAISVFIMVLQVAGSGGTFPPEMLPSVFRSVYPLLPFVHAERSLRACIAGAYGTEIFSSLAILLAMGIMVLSLGFVLTTLFIRPKNYMEEKLEESELM